MEAITQRDKYLHFLDGLFLDSESLGEIEIRNGNGVIKNQEVFLSDYQVVTLWQEYIFKVTGGQVRELVTL